MKKTLIFAIGMLSSFVALASDHQMIDTLGASSKGQYVALEEYGYRQQNKSYYVTIKIMNVWKKEYVGKSFEVEKPAIKPVELIKAREQAKFMAEAELKKYKIQTSL